LKLVSLDVTPPCAEVVLDDLAVPPDRSQAANRPGVPCVGTL